MKELSVNLGVLVQISYENKPGQSKAKSNPPVINQKRATEQSGSFS